MRSHRFNQAISLTVNREHLQMCVNHQTFVVTNTRDFPYRFCQFRIRISDPAPAQPNCEHREIELISLGSEALLRLECVANKLRKNFSIDGSHPF